MKKAPHQAKSNDQRGVSVLCWLLLAYGLLYSFPLQAQYIASEDSLKWQVDWKGQLSLWSNSNLSYAPYQHFGGRYIPELQLDKRLPKSLSLTMDFAAIAQGQLSTLPFDTLVSQGNIDLYRAWLRVSGKQFEWRLGLQKINFGTSTILRPLRWFDQIDPRDPLQITQGVYGLLGKYTFLNNANVWLWFLEGNHQRKGWDILPTARWQPEWGGRMQLPIPRGEVALSYHHRKVDAGLFEQGLEVPENRYGLDAKWDLGVGLWIESSYTRQAFFSPSNQWLALIGADYTLPIGSGLNIGSEYLHIRSGSGASVSSNNNDFIAFQALYSISFFHSLSAIAYIDLTGGQAYNFFNYQMSLNSATLYFMAYWNPRNTAGFQATNALNAYGGRGLQIMWVWNY